MRLIDADKSKDIVSDAGFWEAEDKEVAIYCIDATPTIDAVEVVRCKDCKHQSVYCTTVDCNMRTIYSYFCVLHGTYHESDWFCADREE